MGTGRAPFAVSGRAGPGLPRRDGHPDRSPGAGSHPPGKSAIRAPAASSKVRERLSSEENV